MLALHCLTTIPPAPCLLPLSITPPRKAATKGHQSGKVQTDYRRSPAASVRPWLAQSATDQKDRGDAGGVVVGYRHGAVPRGGCGDHWPPVVLESSLRVVRPAGDDYSDA